MRTQQISGSHKLHVPGGELLPDTTVYMIVDGDQLPQMLLVCGDRHATVEIPGPVPSGSFEEIWEAIAGITLFDSGCACFIFTGSTTEYHVPDAFDAEFFLTSVGQFV